MSVRLHIIRRAGSFVAALFLAACGGGGGGDAAAPAEPVVRVEVTPAALMFTASGQQQRLSARGFDAQGREVAAASVVWQALRPTQVDVAADGTVRANVALGAGQVVAVVGGVRSAPVLVSVAQPQPGVVLVNDSQVLSGPTAAEPGAEPDVDNAYDVVLAGLPAPPAPGSLMLGREGISLGGEVVESQAVAGGVRVRLRLVPIEQLMLTAQIQEEIDLRGLPLDVPPDIAALYDVNKEGDEYVFTPKPGAAAAVGRKGPQAIFPKKLGPFECELATPELPISLSSPAGFSIKFEPIYVIDYDRNTGLRKLVVKAETSFKVKANVQINAALVVNLTCEITLSKVVPLPGWAGLVLAAQIKYGVGFELEGSTTIPLVGAELSAESKGPMEIGVDCTSGTCLLVSAYDPVNTSGLRMVTPDQVPTNTRNELFLFGYGMAQLKAGLTAVPEARIDVATARGGLKFETNLAQEATQLAPVAAGLPDYRSDYKLHLLAEVVAGSQKNKGESAFRKLLQKLGVFKVTLLKTQISRPLGVSPKGAVTVDRSVFSDGDTLSFNVQLDAETAFFPGLGYNVRRIRIVRLTDGLQTREVASVDATSEQLSFDLSWVASGTAGETAGAFYAFVDTVLPTPVGLELGQATVAPKVLSGPFNFVYTETETSDDGKGNVSTSTNDFRVMGRAVQATLGADTFSLLDATGLNRLRESETTQSERGRLLPDGRLCTFATTSVSSTSADLPVLASPNNEAEFSFTGNDWRLDAVYAEFLGDATSTFKSDATKIGGPADCSVFDLNVPETSQTETGRGVSLRKSIAPPLPPITGSFGANPTNGRRTLLLAANANGLLPGSTAQNSRSYTLALNMSLEEGLAPTTDLALTLDALPFAEPLGFMTYAVNLTNKGGRAANDVRAEFTLPAGWALIGTTGWSGCTTTGTVVVCRAASLAAGERRAFLVDTQAPNGTGSFIARARVSAAEGDSDFSNNTAQAVTEIPAVTP